MTSTWSNLPSSEDGSRTLASQPVALWGGIAVTLLIGLPVGFGAVETTMHAIAHLVMFLIAAYVVAMTIQYWVSQAWKKGLTTKECLLALFWPADLVRHMVRGAKIQNCQTPANISHSGPKIVSEGGARIIGLLLIGASVVMLFVGIAHALAAVGALIWLCILLWVCGMFVQYWVSQAWRDGFTTRELFRAIIWPIGMGSLVRTGAKFAHHFPVRHHG